MTRHVLFVHGGGEGAYEEDKTLVASLRDALGAAYDVRYPKMPNEDAPEYAAWKDRIANEIAASDGEVILVGHSLGASILLKYVSEEEIAKPVAGLFLVAPPYWGAEDWEVGEYELQRDFASKLPEGLWIFYTTVATTKWCPSDTSRCTRTSFRRRPSVGSTAEGTSSPAICPRLLRTSVNWRGEMT